MSPWAGWLHCFRSHSNSSVLIHPGARNRNFPNADLTAAGFTAQQQCERFFPDTTTGAGYNDPRPHIWWGGSRRRDFCHSADTPLAIATETPAKRERGARHN